jgi:CRISPR/Cas system CSM-associated protein Csm2 small subunit
VDALTATIIGGVISLCVSIIAGVAIHRTNKARDAIDKAVNDITVLQQIAVTDSHVRKIFKEEVMPLSLNSEKMLASMHNIEIFIAEQKGYNAARLEAKRSRSTDTPL